WGFDPQKTPRKRETASALREHSPPRGGSWGNYSNTRPAGRGSGGLPPVGGAGGEPLPAGGLGVRPPEHTPETRNGERSPRALAATRWILGELLEHAPSRTGVRGLAPGGGCRGRTPPCRGPGGSTPRTHPGNEKRRALSASAR